MLQVDMYYNRESISTILAMKDVINMGARVYMDTNKERAMVVTYQGKSYKCKECSSRLYYYTMEKEKNNKIKSINTNLIQTVKNKMGRYTKRVILKANEGTDMKRYYFLPSKELVNKYSVENQIRKCAFTTYKQKKSYKERRISY